MIMEGVSRSIEGHQISIKIFRLKKDGIDTQDSLSSPNPMYTDSNFGTVHLGEKFICHLVIKNESTFKISSIQLKVELQSSTQRNTLFDSEEGALELRADESWTIQASNDIKEVGVHIVVCSLHYINPVTEERKFFRKFFKFAVINPLSLKTKVTESPIPEIYYLEAQIQNVSNSIFNLESVRLIVEEPIKLLPIDISNRQIDEFLADLSFKDVLDGQLYPENIFEYAFAFTCSLSEIPPDPIPLGKLDITWISDTGEMGHLQTGTIIYHEQAKDQPVSYYFENLPRIAQVNEPFPSLMILRNKTDRDLKDLKLITDLSNEDDIPLVSLGNCEIHLGGLTRRNSTRYNLVFLPLKCGIINLNTLWLEFIDGGSVQRIKLKLIVIVDDGNKK